MVVSRLLNSGFPGQLRLGDVVLDSCWWGADAVFSVWVVWQAWNNVAERAVYAWSNDFRKVGLGSIYCEIGRCEMTETVIYVLAFTFENNNVSST